MKTDSAAITPNHLSVTVENPMSEMKIARYRSCQRRTSAFATESSCGG